MLHIGAEGTDDAGFVYAAVVVPGTEDELAERVGWIPVDVVKAAARPASVANMVNDKGRDVRPKVRDLST